MLTCRTGQALKKAVDAYRRRKFRVGFVPTMGALHDGHLSLVRRAKRENDRVVVSIFVNPTQFGPKEDFSRYPRPLARDKRLLKGTSTDLLFLPAASEMYPEGFQTRVSVGEVSKPLCGQSRPVHFSGVATVVLKLLEVVRPDRLYLGQKDYQQVLVVSRMIRDLQVPVEVRMVETAREADGLAMSSRNVFLTTEERREAPGIYLALQKAKAAAQKGERRTAKLRQILKKELRTLRRARVDYAEVLDAETLRPVVELSATKAVVAACAVFYAKARLIDNLILRA